MEDLLENQLPDSHLKTEQIFLFLGQSNLTTFNHLEEDLTTVDMFYQFLCSSSNENTAICQRRPSCAWTSI